MLKQFFICLIVVTSIGCSKDFDFEKNRDLPLSTLTYTEEYDGQILTYNYLESEGIIFRDERDLENVDCDLFSVTTFIKNDKDDTSFSLGFISHINADQLENNEQLLKDENLLHEIMYRDPIFFANEDFCLLPESETGIFAVASAIPVSTLVTTTSIEDMVITKFERETFRHDGLGYILLDLEMNYTAIQFEIPNINEVFYVPATVKLNHAIRFPELDKK